MSGRTKRILYRITDFLLYCAAFAGAILLAFFTTPEQSETSMAMCVLLIAIALKVPVWIHELGHLLFGLAVGMKLVSFRVRLFSGNTAGFVKMIPKNGRHVRAKTIVFDLGGALLNLLLGGALFTLYFVLPYHSGLLVCAMFALFLFYEGLRALIPAELPEGKTDGAVLVGILKHASEEEIFLRVLTVQGILYRGTFSDVQEGLLLKTPAVREDLPAFHALLMLRAQYFLDGGRRKEAEETFRRLQDADEYLDSEQKKEISRYCEIFRGEFRAEKQLLFGLDELEKKLETSVAAPPSDRPETGPEAKNG